MLNVLSTNTHSYDEIIHNATMFRDPHSTDIGGRPATVLPDAATPNECSVVVNIAADPVQFKVLAKPSADTVGDSCTEVVRIANALAKDLPAGK